MQAYRSARSTLRYEDLIPVAERMDAVAGKRDQLSKQIQESYGITKDQAERWLKAFEQVHKDSQPKSQA